MSNFSFSVEFPQRWYNTPTATKKAIKQELQDLLAMLQPETRLNGFEFHDTTSETTFQIEPTPTAPVVNVEMPATSKTDNLVVMQQQNEARLIKQLTEQTKIPETAVKPTEAVKVQLENPYSHDIETIKQQIIQDIRQQIATDIKDGLLQWLSDQVEKQVESKMRHLM